MAAFFRETRENRERRERRGNRYMSRGTVEIVVYGSFIKQKKAVRDDGAPFTLVPFHVLVTSGES